MKNFERSVVEQEPEYDEILENLWSRYGFDGNPPRLHSEAERRLKEKCERYATYIINAKKNKGSSSDAMRRQLHNEIAIMTVGKQRSGMDLEDANHISNFALSYTHGLTLDDIDSGKFDDML